MEFITKSPAQTKEVGKKFADFVIDEKKNSFTAALVGDLGSGKTTFIQGFAQGLGIKQRIISPTFILVRMYQLPGRGIFESFYHIDFYRITQDPYKEARNLGLSDILSKKGNIVVIEWGEKIKNILPKGSYWIEFENLGEESRKIFLKKL